MAGRRADACRILGIQTYAEKVSPEEVPLFLEVSDQAALARMHRFLQSQRKTLHDLGPYLSDGFARLYRQRDLVLHRGKTNALAHCASLPNAAALVGAGTDRIAHGYFVQE